ncbi:MAG: heavy metal translocating P-type ATPase [Phycisphaerales bacterium]|nr:heavy metal translocating P-type ATPase [Phycisphaerales bacterium]
MSAIPTAISAAPSAAEQVLCSHCSLPVPPGLVIADSPLQFCCHGCSTAYEVIHSCGLDRYYALRESSDRAPTAARTTGRRYAEFDDPAFLELYARRGPAAPPSIELFLEGVHCAACVWLVEKLPQIVPGVIEARLDLRRAIVRLTWDDRAAALSRIAGVLDSLGYAPHPARQLNARQARRVEDRRALIRIGVAGACAGNVMLLAIALYAGVFDAMESQYHHFFRWVSMLLSLVSLAGPGSVFFRGAIAALRTRTLHLDVPIAVGLLAGAVWGVLNTIAGWGEIYFDSLSVLVFALLVGRFIQARQQRWASDAVELLFSLTPTSARLVEGESAREVPIETLKAGDLVEVRAGDSFPADGIITTGRSQVDQSLLTGESRPVTVGEGDAVSAGAVNLSGLLRFRVEAAGEQTRVARLMRMVEEGSARKAPIVRLADRIAGWFVAGMLVLAAITAAVWWSTSPAKAIDNAVALLIVTCPCALGLATPLAIAVTVGRGAGRGILIKGGDAVERLARPGTIYLDKTGTITEGRMSLVRWFGDDDVRPLVAEIERHSSHPIARALVEALSDDRNSKPKTGDITAYSSGLEGVIDGRAVLIGSSAFIRTRLAHRPAWLDDAEARATADALTPVLIAVDGEIRAVAAVGDAVRPDARASIDRLHQLGWRVGILSGDHPAVVSAVARQLGVEDARGGMAPEDKLSVVAESAKAGPVVMVGDGVNDAAALSAAGVGIAVHRGAEASLSAADVSLSRPGLGPIVELISASRRTLNVIYRNLAASLFYNGLAAALAITGVINPLIAAILMPASSLTVLTLSFKSRTFGPAMNQEGSG